MAASIVGYEANGHLVCPDCVSFYKTMVPEDQTVPVFSEELAPNEFCFICKINLSPQGEK